MVRIIEFKDKYKLESALQSSSINLLIGSGASAEAIKPLGNIEKEINDFIQKGQQSEATTKKLEFIESVRIPTNQLISDEFVEKNNKVIGYYSTLLQNLTRMLIRRKTQLLPTQATIFTTNYDLFIEKAAENQQEMRLNDGFSRIPSLRNRFEFSPQNFFETTYSSGNLYDYKVEIPSINLIKLHGSFSWKRDDEVILYQVKTTDELHSEPTKEDIENYIKQFAIVLPQQDKFQETVLDRTYYDLLRIYSNQLDRKNALLIVFGFSFADEHICDITRRALKNPTLKMIIFSYTADDADKFDEKFKGFSNVEIVKPPRDSWLGFEKFNSTLAFANPVKEDVDVR